MLPQPDIEETPAFPHTDVAAVCWLGPDSVSTHFLMTPLGTSDSGCTNQIVVSTMTSEISTTNIVMPSLEKLPKETRKTFLERRRAPKEARKAREERELQEYLACFKKDHQGSISQVKEPVLPAADDDRPWVLSM